jgi:hypothetical protein
MKDEALAILQKALDQNKYTFRYLRLINSPHYENLRTDPRFQQIVAEAKSQYEERVRKYGDL